MTDQFALTDDQLATQELAGLKRNCINRQNRISCWIYGDSR